MEHIKQEYIGIVQRWAFAWISKKCCCATVYCCIGFVCDVLFAVVDWMGTSMGDSNTSEKTQLDFTELVETRDEYDLMVDMFNTILIISCWIL